MKRLAEQVAAAFGEAQQAEAAGHTPAPTPAAEEIEATGAAALGALLGGRADDDEEAG